MRRAFLLCLLIAGLAACSDTLVPLAFEVQLQVSQTAAAPGDTINVTVNAQGGTLLGVVVHFGDGENDQYEIGGARTAHVTFRHAYAAPGTFRVEATVTDADAGDKTAALDVSVQ